MSLTPDKVRELAARSEGTFLDFKVEDYDWNGSKKSANAELAKDLMAMANALSPGAAPAHILVGVRNDGTIVGIPSHEDDATLHQKVKDFFIRSPLFEYAPVSVDGCSVGVYTIKPGGRPHFPLRDSGSSLHKHVAVYRDGTSTAIASPNMILDWDREDDPIRHEQRILELRRLEFEIKKQEAQARIHAKFGVSHYNHDSDRILLHLTLRNDSQCGIFIESLEWHITWKPGFIAVLESIKASLPEHYLSPSGKISFDNEFIQADAPWVHLFIWTNEQFRGHLASYDMAPGIVGYKADWVALDFEVICRSELGGEATLSCSV